MAATRGHPEFNKRLGEFFTHGTSPCPDCGLDMPAGDYDLRMAHYAVCPGKRVDGVAQIEIDAEFKSLIPKLSDDEYAALGTSLLAEGCRDALVVWRSAGSLILVDGHNRHEICTEHNIPFKTLEREFADRNDVIVWMLRNQLGRRNLTDSARIRAAVRLKEVFETEAKERQSAAAQQTNEKLGRGKKTLPPNSAEASKGESRDKAADMAGVGKTKFSEGEYVMKHAPVALQVRWDNEEISTHAAYVLTKALEGKPQPVIDLALRVAGDNPEKVDILVQLHKSGKRDGSNETFAEIEASGGFHTFGKDKDDKTWCDFAGADIRTIKAALASIAKQHIQVKRDERIAEIVAQGTTELNEAPALFNVVYADPPWRYEHSISDSRAIENQYPTMLLEEICALPVASIITNPAILFLWATSPKLDEAMTVLKAWGFIYKTCMVWDKERIGMGYYARQQHELLLIGTCGDMPTPPPSERPASVIRERRSETHSQKPTLFRDLITRMYPDFHKVELFAREETEGWYGWGYESNRS